jgi:hypothetical protein
MQIICNKNIYWNWSIPQFLKKNNYNNLYIRPSVHNWVTNDKRGIFWNGKTKSLKFIYKVWYPI